MEGIAFDENIQISIKKEKVDEFEVGKENISAPHSVEQVNGVTDIKTEVTDDVEMIDKINNDGETKDGVEDEIIQEDEDSEEEEIIKENEISDEEDDDEVDADEDDEDEEIVIESEKAEEENSNEDESEIITADDDENEEVLDVDEENEKEEEEDEDDDIEEPKVYYASDLLHETSEDVKLVEGSKTCPTCGKHFKSIEYFHIHKRLHLEGRLKKFSSEPTWPTPGTSGTGATSKSTDCGSESQSSDSDDSASEASGFFAHTVTPNSSSHKFRSRLREGRSDLLVEGPRVCKFCGKTFYSMDYYRIHQRVHVSEKLKHVPLQQTKQNKGPGGKSSAASSQDHQVISVYPQMGVLDVKESPMNNQKVPGTKRCCVCDVCHLTFPNYRSLILHRKIHRKGLCTVYPLYVCSVCNRGFVSKASFLTHCDFHDAKPWTCDVCGMTFSKKLYLGMHKTSKHKQKRYDFKCDDCGKLFEKSKDLQKHMKMHNPEKPQEQIKISCLCQVCGKMLPLQSTKDLRIHMGIHFGEILQCHICPEIFRETDEFKEHMDRHLGL